MDFRKVARLASPVAQSRGNPLRMGGRGRQRVRPEMNLKKNMNRHKNRKDILPRKKIFLDK